MKSFLLSCVLLLPLPGLAADLTPEQLQARAEVEACMAGRSDQQVRENCRDIGFQACKARQADEPYTVQMVICSGADIVGWRAHIEALYAELLARVECTDPLRLDQGYPAAADSLKAAHAAWLVYMEAGADAEYVSLRWGMGTLRLDDPQRFVRDQVMERALLYRDWLGQPEWICLDE